MKRVVILAGAVLVGACGNPARSYNVPAPAGALDCALRVMGPLGYSPVAGGTSSGFIKFNRRVGRTVAGTLGAMIPGRGNQRMGDFVTITGAGQTLQIVVVGYDGAGNPVKPSDEALGHAQAVVSACGNPATDTVGR